jgi:SAM-dependent methyltransferase
MEASDLSKPARPASYDPTRCDLCHTQAASPLLNVQGRSLTSDSRVVELDIEKIECRRCGLVRSGRPFDATDLARHYRDRYVLGLQADIAEPLLPYGDDLAPRSQIFGERIAQTLFEGGFPKPRAILEVGCGEGRLLQRMVDRWPHVIARGLELAPGSVDAARRRGLRVDIGGFEEMSGSYDLIYAVAVLEHLPQPSAFFARAAAALADGGVLVVTQPAQDRPSSDIFFVDHLWHFAAAHVDALAATAGLVPTADVEGPVPTFSLHILARGESDARQIRVPVAHQARRAVAKWEAIFRRVDRWLDERDERPLLVWGVGQTFDLLLAYTNLGEARITAGVEENLARFPAGSRPFPVLAPQEAITAVGAADVLVTFSPPTRVTGLLECSSLRSFLALDDDSR